MSEPKKCEKCGAYLCICKNTIYAPPLEPFSRPKRYGEVGKSLFPQGRPHPPAKAGALTRAQGESL